MPGKLAILLATCASCLAAASVQQNQRNATTFNTVADLLIYGNPKNLNSGAVIVLGYTNISDGYGGVFSATNTTSGVDGDKRLSSGVTGWSWDRVFYFSPPASSGPSGPDSNWRARGSTNSTLPGIASANEFDATSQVKIGVGSTSPGIITLYATNSTFPVTIQVDSAGTLTFAYGSTNMLKVNLGSLANFNGSATNFLSAGGYYTNPPPSINPTDQILPFNNSGSLADSLLKVGNIQTIILQSGTNPPTFSLQNLNTNVSSAYLQGFLKYSSGSAEAGLITFAKAGTGWGAGTPSARDGSIGFNTLHDNVSYNRLNIDGDTGDVTFFDRIGGSIIFTLKNAGVGTALSGFSSTATDAAVTIASTGWTNTFGKNALVYLDGVGLTFTVYNNAGTAVYTNNTALGGDSIILQPSGKVIITAGTSVNGRATPF